MTRQEAINQLIDRYGGTYSAFGFFGPSTVEIFTSGDSKVEKLITELMENDKKLDAYCNVIEEMKT